LLEERVAINLMYVPNVSIKVDGMDKVLRIQKNYLHKPTVDLKFVNGR
jgi:hypothetical protein